jgi:uncharacterized damage-inducible protein DinB
MRKKILCLFPVVVLCATSFGQTLSQADRERAANYLESTKKGVLDSVAGLSDAQWNFKAGPDRWSIAQVMEHIAAAEDYLRGNVSENIMKAPPRPAGEEVRSIDDLVVAAVPDRSHKVQAPEPLRPTNRFGSPQASLAHFIESRDKTLAFLQNTPDLRQHAVDSPLGKKLDAYEWVLFIAAHSERHTKQINEVKADPRFPKQ